MKMIIKSFLMGAFIVLSCNLYAQYQNARNYKGSSPIETILTGQWFDRQARVIIKVDPPNGFDQSGIPFQFPYSVIQYGRLIETGFLTVSYLRDGRGQRVIFHPRNGKNVTYMVESSHVNRIVFKRDLENGNYKFMNWYNVKYER